MITELHRRIVAAVTRAHRDEEAQGLVEYALVLVFIALVVIITLMAVGHQVNNSFSNVANGL